MDCGKVGALIAQVRKERGLTQAALAERLGVTGKAVSKWERGAGCPDVRWFSSRDEARDALLTLFGPGDAVLLKASHFLNRFDLAADYLREYSF